MENKVINPKIKHVFGNVLRIAVPLVMRQVEVVDGVITTTDYDFIPNTDYPVIMEFIRCTSVYKFKAEVRDNTIAYVEESGQMPVGLYSIAVLCRDGHGRPLRFKERAALAIVDCTADAGIQDGIEYEVETQYLDGAVFFGAAGKGIEYMDVQESQEQGGPNVMTFYFTDGTTQTLTVLNGSAEGYMRRRVLTMVADGAHPDFTDEEGNTLTDAEFMAIANDKDNYLQVVYGRGLYLLTSNSVNQWLFFDSATGEFSRFFVLADDGEGNLYISEQGQTNIVEQVNSDWDETDRTSKAFILNKPTIPTVPTNVSAFDNDAGYIARETDPTVPAHVKGITQGDIDNWDGKQDAISDLQQIRSGAALGATALQSFTETDPTVPAWAKAPTKPTYTPQEVGALPDDTVIPPTLTRGEGINIDNNVIKTTGIPFGEVDDTSTATHFTATVPGIYKLEDGVAVMLKNGVVTSAAGFTLDVNGLGGKPCYTNLASATQDTTIYNIAYTMLFIYDSSRGDDGGWICYRGIDTNTNTIGYQVRTNSMSMPATHKFCRYRLLFTSSDCEHFVPANTSTSTNATSSRAVNQEPINPFGAIVYYGTTSSVDAGARPSASSLWSQNALSLGYSFNRTGAALTLTPWKPVYIKCAPQTDGSAIIDADNPFVQDLPTTNDGKIYIHLGVAYSSTGIELNIVHPVYYHNGNGIRLWTGE